MVGSSKFFFENYSKFYDHYLGSYRIVNGTPSGDNQVQGYNCVSTGTQAMPPASAAPARAKRCTPSACP